MGNIIVYSASIAKRLLKMGYSIVDISENKLDRGQTTKRTVFFFKNEDDIENIINNIKAEMSSKKVYQ